jgi:hypothetical protein
MITRRLAECVACTTADGVPRLEDLPDVRELVAIVSAP